MSGGSDGIATRRAGAYARSRALALTLRFIAYSCVGIAIVLIIALGFRHLGLIAVGIQLAVLVAVWLTKRHFDPRIDRLLQGAAGEGKVGDILDELEGSGWFALHNVAFGSGDIDHVLIGPGGIFAIETKSHRTPRSVGRIDETMLRQAYAEAKSVERVTGYKVTPMLVFSDAWIFGRLPAQRRGVTITSARMLKGHFEGMRPMVTAERAREVHGRLCAALDA